MKSWGQQSLRRKLTAISVVAVAFALLVSGVIATTALRSYLVDQVDRQIVGVSKSPDLAAPQPSDGARQPRLPGGVYIQFFDSEGNSTKVIRDPFADPDTAPDLAGAVPEQEGTEQEGTEQEGSSRTPFTVAGVDGGPDWRVVVRPIATGSVAVAQSLADVDAIVGRLRLLLMVVGVGVVLVVGGLVAWLVRRNLRPLSEVERTAESIAAGDMSHRVPDYPTTTEVGQVARAMNKMLERMAGAFSRREEALSASRESEAKMRRFVADASHELRTPLTSIRGLSELYRQGAVADVDVAETFARIEGESNRMGDLVEDLLELARLDQQQQIEMHPVDVLAVVLGAVQSASSAHPDRSIRFESCLSESDAAAPIVQGDERRIGQILRVLIENAVAYSSLAVVVELGVEGAAVTARVLDSGLGVPDEEKERIFERFYRADGSRARNSGGSGLGLSIARGLAHAHGGAITVSDRTGGGSAFTVTVPLVDARAGV